MMMIQKNFFTNWTYLGIISLVTTIFWYFGLEAIGIPLYLFICFILLIFVRNSIFIFPYLLNVCFMISQTEWDLTLIPTYLYIAPTFGILGIVIHAIRFKTNLFKGDFFIGVGLLSVAMIISTLINMNQLDLNTIFILAVSILFVLLYGFLANSVKGDYTLFLIKIFVVLGIMISLQVAIFYLDVYINGGLEALQHSVDKKTLDLGWGISNFVATYLIMFISATLYFVKKYKLHIGWILVILFEIVMLVFTLSRAGILAFMFTGVFLLLFMFIKNDQKLKLLLYMGIGLVIVSVGLYFLRDFIVMIYERFAYWGLGDHDRIEMWEEAIQNIKEAPIFGKGIFVRTIKVHENELRLYHNTFLQIIASFGILGGLSLIVQFMSILKIFLRKLNGKKAILLIALIGANIQGMVDNTYFMPQYLIIMFMVIAVVENANKVIEPETRLN